MRNERADEALGNEPVTTVDKYIEGLNAALRTHQTLTEKAPLEVKVHEDHEIPLAQRILLR